MKAHRLILILIISSFILSPLLSALVVNPPAIPRDFTSAGTYYHSSGNNAYFAVDQTMTFTQVVIDSKYVMFNNTGFNITSPNRINISLDYINSSMTSGSSTSLRVAFYAQTTTGTSHFNISGFASGVEYEITRDNVSLTTDIANATGSIYFNNGSWGAWKYYEIFGGDSTPPAIEINFAGNLSESGGPYWRPPGESDILDEVAERIWRDGYYTNDSYQQEDYVYINLTITDNVKTDSVKLHWYNYTANSWDNTSSFTNTIGDLWEYNKTGVPQGKYSFDIWANDTSNNINLVWWNKTKLTGGYTRRYVHLNNAPVNISYTPLYLYFSGLYNTITDTNKYDRLHHDQGTDAGGVDVGYLLTNTPIATVNQIICGTYLGVWFDENTCIIPFSLQNIYYHVWWSSGINPNVGWDKNRIKMEITPINQFFTSTSERRSDIYYDGIGGNDIYSLLTKKFTITPYSFTDNDIYQFMLTMGGNLPSIVSNRSFTSFVLLNVPSNATLGATDSDSDGLTDIVELYTTYTNPFLADTDDDSYDDDVEVSFGSDPNNYTDTSFVPWSNHAPTFSEPHPANASTNVNRYNLTSVKVSDLDGNATTVCFYNNKTGSWVLAQVNATVTANTTVRDMNSSWANDYGTKYWWKVTANDGHVNVSAIYYFTTLADTNYIYAGGSATQKVYQYHRLNLTKKAESADYGGTINGLAEDDVYIYVGGDTTQKVYQYWKSNMTKKAESANGGNIESLYIDDTYLYFPDSSTQKICQYWKSNFSKKAESTSVGDDIVYLIGDTTYIYISGYATQKIYQYYKFNLTKKAESSSYGGTIYAITEDDTYVYVGGGTTQKVYQYWKSNLTKKAETLGYGGSIADINNDDTYVYVGGATTRKVYQYWISNMTKKAETLNYGGTITAISVDSTYIYAGGTTTNKVYQYWKSNLTKKAESADYGGNIYVICANLSSDVYTPPVPTPWSNHAPTLTLEVPTNASVSISRWPQLSVKVTDADGNNSKVFWYTNATGAWTQIQVNTSVLNTTVRKMNFTQASVYNTKYWWRVSANDTNSNTTETYHFTTLVASSSVTSVPFNFNAEWVGDTSINISWDVNGNNKTVIVRKAGSYPTGPTDGTVVYNGTGTSNNTYFTTNLISGWNNIYFPNYIFTQNSSISVNNTVENFLQQSGIWDDVDWVFYDDGTGLKSWGKGLPPIFITLHYITYDASNPYQIHTTSTCTLSFLLDNITGSATNYFYDVGLDISTRYYYRAWSLNGTVFSPSSAKLILAYSGSSSNVEETTASISGYLVTDKTCTARVLYGYTTTYGTNSTNVTISTSGAITKVLSGLTPGRLYQYITYANDSTGNITFGNDPPFLTKPQAPTNTSTTLNFGTMKFNLSWDNGIGANKTVVRVKSTGYPTSPIDGTLVYNGTVNYTLYSFALGNSYYFKAWSYANCSIPLLHEFSDNGTTFSLVGTGGLIINCFDENTNANLTFNVKVSNQSGSQVYENNGCTNSHAINESLCPHGNYIQIIVSATGYHQRIYTLNIYAGMIYILNARLPPETAPGNGTEDCELRPYIDSKTITSYAVDAVVALTHTLDSMISVEIYNSSLYGTYGGWLFVAGNKNAFTSTSVTVNKTVLDKNTTMARVNYYYNFCEGGVESALYNLRVVETIDTGYGQSDQAVENVLMQVKRYINSTGTFVDVSSIFTDANGYVNIYLVPDAHYKIFLNKSGYDDVIGADYIPAPPNEYGQTIEKWFRITKTITPDYNITYGFWDLITFNAIMYLNNTIKVTFIDNNFNTTNAQFYTYSLYNFTSTLISTNTTLSDTFIFWIRNINSSRTHQINIYLNHTILGYQQLSILVLPVNHTGGLNVTDIENKLKNIFGDNLLGFVKFFLVFIPAIVILILPGRKHPGFGIIAAGLWMGFASIKLSVAPEMAILIPFIIAIGIILMLVKEGGFKL